MKRLYDTQGWDAYWREELRLLRVQRPSVGPRKTTLAVSGTLKDETLSGTHRLRQMQNVALGFRPDGLLLASMDLGLQQYSIERGRQFIETVRARAEELPGGRSATAAVHVPLDYGLQVTDVTIDGEIPGTSDGHLSVATIGGVQQRRRPLPGDDRRHARARPPARAER
jgi:hypothetical protein